MSLWSRCRSWYAAVTSRDSLAHQMDDELQFHLAQQVADLRQRGVEPAEAARRARVAFGGMAVRKDELQEALGLGLLDELRADLVYAFRQIRWAPGFAATVIASLALGIGATLGIFSLLNALMLHPLPVRAPHELVQLLTNAPGEPRILGFSWRAYEDYRERNHVFSDLIGVATERFQVGARGPQQTTVSGGYVSDNFFQALGLEPTIGRLIGTDERRQGTGAAVAVLSWAYWTRQFQGDARVLGKTVVLAGVPATVIGVGPRGFVGVQFGVRTDVWVPMAMESLVSRPGSRPTESPGMTLGMNVLGRLKPGVSLAQARAELKILDQRRIEEMVAKNGTPFWRQVQIDVEPAAAGPSALRDQFGRPLVGLLVGVGLLLLITCTNVASMLVARGMARRRETAVRMALGAGRWRVIRQGLTEALVLTTGGSVIGLTIATLVTRRLLSTLVSGRPPIGFPGPIDVQLELDVRVIGFALILTILTALIAGLITAWHAVASAPAGLLQERGAMGETRSRRILGHGFVVAQVALSVVLVAGASVFSRHLSGLQHDDLGFSHDAVLVAILNPQGSGYNSTQLTQQYQDLSARLAAIPGVRSVAFSGTTPIEGGAASRFAFVDGFVESPEERRRVMMNWVGPGYFETLRTALLAGREFVVEDLGRPRVAIVNQALARHYFGSNTPIGHQIRFERDEHTYEIVGVVADAKYVSLHEPAPRTAYLHAWQAGPGSHVALRTTVPPMTVASDVRRVLSEVVPTIRVQTITTLAAQMDASLLPERLVALLASAFGGLATLLVAIGLYGVLAYAVSRRTGEMGVRMALGATRWHVMSLVLRNAARVVGAGLLMGVPLAIGGVCLATSMLDQVRPGLETPLVVAGLTMSGVGVLAALVPARRAARLDPMEALRQS